MVKNSKQKNRRLNIYLKVITANNNNNSNKTATKKTTTTTTTTKKKKKKKKRKKEIEKERNKKEPITLYITVFIILFLITVLWLWTNNYLSITSNLSTLCYTYSVFPRKILKDTANWAHKNKQQNTKNKKEQKTSILTCFVFISLFNLKYT